MRGGIFMAESKNDLTENKKKRPNKLTNARIKKEIEFLEKMFVFLLVFKISFYNMVVCLVISYQYILCYILYLLFLYLEKFVSFFYHSKKY